ncbi:unnamed protein product [Lactuca saligna]|uniref:RRM domain-containing protein n=1 Tax=Lactuca saligna TaxID=75948 RepID=A0AA35ZF93_LACSI|nr:unnamed protein product [Lactuca saligna]
MLWCLMMEADDGGGGYSSHGVGGGRMSCLRLLRVLYSVPEMADGYWSRQREQQQQQQQQEQQQLYSSASLLKRPRSDYDLPPAGLPFSYEMSNNYLPQNDDLGGAHSHAIKDTKTIGSAYDHYLQTAKPSSGEGSGYGVVSGVGREIGGGMHSFPLSDPISMTRGGPMGLDHGPNGRALQMDHHNHHHHSFVDMNMMGRGVRETLPLPADASSTLYIEGLPPNCTRREVAHIFRPFVGYKEVRLVSKESKHQRNGDPVVISFVDFSTPACAATAMSALQGYKMDEHDPDSAYLRLQFSKYPGPRSGPTRRGGRR